MYHIYSPSFAKIIQQVQKLRRKLQRFVVSPSLQQQKLQKRYERYLQKLSALVSPALKAGAILSSTALLSTSVPAQRQPCDSFSLTAKSNPLRYFQNDYIKPAFVDIDGDGDLDCYTELYESADNHPAHISFLRNTGSKAIPVYQPDTLSGFPRSLTFNLGIFPSNIDGTKFIDLDGDGDYDCLLGAYESDGVIRYFENTGTAQKPIFTERTGSANPFSFVYGYYGLHFTLADLDSDGDYDLVTSVSYHQRFYKNVGGPNKPSFKLYKTENGLLGFPYTFYDWNKDGLLDEFADYNLYYKNTGTAKNPAFTYSTDGPRLPDGFGTILQFVDINNDGYTEIFDYQGNMASTAPDAYITSDSTKSNTLYAYPKNKAYTYRWQRNGKAIAGANSSNYTPTQPGTYTVKITGSCGTGTSAPYQVYVVMHFLSDDFIAQNTLGALSNAMIKAYPNPFAASFVMQLNGDADLSKTSIRITDLQGRIVEVIKPNSYTIYAGEKLAKGMYVVQVLKGSEVMYEQR